MPWDDPERTPNPRLKEPGLDVVSKLRIMLDGKRSALEFMRGLQSQDELRDYEKGNVNCLLQTIADLEAILSGVS